MKKFNVEVVATTWKTTKIEVEAENKQKAEKLAIKKAHEDESNEWTVLAADKYQATATRINPPYDTVDFPAYALSALINDDISGLSADDLKYLHNWTRAVETRIRSQHGQKCQIIYKPGENTYFSTAQVFGLPADCVELEIHVIPENPLYEENMK